jgi:kynureninase
MADKFYNSFLPHGEARLKRIEDFTVEISMVASDGKEEFCFILSEPIVIQANTFASIIGAAARDVDKAPPNQPGYRAALVKKISATIKRMLTEGVIMFEDEAAESDIYIADDETAKIDDDGMLYKIPHTIAQVN